MIRYLLRRAAVEVSWVRTAAGYWLRPYDTLADRRRWRWQPATRCGGVLIILEDPRA